ncbi:importin-7, putative, partial [Hepatocystis sp. ex Piliocolobus tephrosceles]
NINQQNINQQNINQHMNSDTNNTDGDNEYLKHLPQFKCKKNVLIIINRLLSRYINNKYNKFSNELTEKFCTIFLNKWLSIYFQDFIIILQSYFRNKKTLTDECLVYVLRGLSYGVENSLVYKNYIKSNISFIIRDIIFPIVCYDNEDIEKLEFDEYDFTMNQFNNYMLENKKTNAINFVLDLTRYRGNNHITDIFELCISYMNTYNQNCEGIYSYQPGDIIINNNTTNIHNNGNIMLNNKKYSENYIKRILFNNYCKYKYGSMQLLECLHCRMCDKKRNMNVEQFLKLYIEKDLQSPNYFICYQAIVTYCCFVKKIKEFVDINSILQNYEIILNHMSSDSLLIRVASASNIKKFFKIQNDLLQNLIIKTIPILIERLLNVIKEVKCENVVMTLDNLAYTFKDYISPYVKDVTIAMCTSFVYLINQKEETNEITGNEKQNELKSSYNQMGEQNSMLNTNNAQVDTNLLEDTKKTKETDDMDLNSLIISILNAISSLLDAVDESNKANIYKYTLSYLYVVIDETFKCPSVDYLEEALALFTNITYYLDIDEQVYMRFENLFNIFYFNMDNELKEKELSIIKTNPNLILSTEVILTDKNNVDTYYYDYIYDISFSLGVFDNILSKDALNFINIYSEKYGLKYIHMLYRLGIFALHSKIVKYSSKLFFILFEATVNTKGVNELVVPVLTAFSAKLFKHDEIQLLMNKKKINLQNNNNGQNQKLLSSNQTNTIGEEDEYDDNNSSYSSYDDDLLSKVSLEYIQRLFYSILIYDIDIFFNFFNNINKTKEILLFLTNLEDIKMNHTRKLYILAMSSIIQNMHKDNINIHINDLNTFLLSITNVAQSYHEIKNNADNETNKSTDSYSSSDEENSEIDIDEDEDATNENTLKLLKTIQTLGKKNNLKDKTLLNYTENSTDNNSTNVNNLNDTTINNNNTDTIINNTNLSNLSTLLDKENLKKLKKKQAALEEEEEEEEEDEDDEDYYSNYDDYSDYSDSDDECRQGFFDNINPLKILFDTTNNFYTKYNKMYNEEIANKIKYLVDVENTEPQN